MITIPLLPSGTDSRSLANGGTPANQFANDDLAGESSADSGFFRYIQSLTGETPRAERAQAGEPARSNLGAPAEGFLEAVVEPLPSWSGVAGDTQGTESLPTFELGDKGSILPSGGELFPLLPEQEFETVVSGSEFMHNAAAQTLGSESPTGAERPLARTWGMEARPVETDMDPGVLQLNPAPLASSPLAARDSAAAAAPVSQGVSRAGLGARSTALVSGNATGNSEAGLNTANLGVQAGKVMTGGGDTAASFNMAQGDAQLQGEFDFQVQPTSNGESNENGLSTESWTVARGVATSTNAAASDSGVLAPFAANGNSASSSPETVSGDKIQLSLRSLAGEAGWEQELGDRLRMLVDRGRPVAELRLNPPELGSVEVRISNEGERTSVTFVAANASAREMLESALPKLRDLLADSGLQLANADVSSQHRSGRETSSGEQPLARGVSGEPEGQTEAGGENIVRSYSVGSGSVDFYV